MFYIDNLCFSPNIGPFIRHVRIKITLRHSNSPKKNQQDIGECIDLGKQGTLLKIHGKVLTSSIESRMSKQLRHVFG